MENRWDRKIERSVRRFLSDSSFFEIEGILGLIKEDRKHQREEMKQEPGLIVELNEKVIKKVIRNWLGLFKLFNSALPTWAEDWKGDLFKVEDAIATLSATLVNAKGILKWREEKGG